MIRRATAVRLLAGLGLAVAVVALVLVGRLPLDVAAALGVIAVVGIGLGLLARVVLPSRDGRSALAPADRRIERLSQLIAGVAAAIFVAGLAGVQIAGVNVVIAVFPALAAIGLLHAADALVHRRRRVEAAGSTLFGVGWLALGLTAVGVPELVGMLAISVGGGLAIWTGVRSDDQQAGSTGEPR